MIKVKREKEDMLSFVAQGMDVLFDNPKNAFITTRAWDMLYEGVPINCNHFDFAPKVICAALKSEMKDQIEVVNKTELRISMFKEVKNPEMFF